MEQINRPHMTLFKLQYATKASTTMRPPSPCSPSASVSNFHEITVNVSAVKLLIKLK